jgi:hypothetical protein
MTATAAAPSRVTSVQTKTEGSLFIVFPFALSRSHLHEHVCPSIVSNPVNVRNPALTPHAVNAWHFEWTP